MKDLFISRFERNRRLLRRAQTLQLVDGLWTCVCVDAELSECQNSISTLKWHHVELGTNLHDLIKVFWGS